MSFPWFFEVREILGARPNQIFCGVGNSGSTLDMDIVVPDTAKIQDNKDSENSSVDEGDDIELKGVESINPDGETSDVTPSNPAGVRPTIFTHKKVPMVTLPPTPSPTPSTISGLPGTQSVSVSSTPTSINFPNGLQLASTTTLKDTLKTTLKKKTPIESLNEVAVAEEQTRKAALELKQLEVKRDTETATICANKRTEKRKIDSEERLETKRMREGRKLKELDMQKEKDEHAYQLQCQTHDMMMAMMANMNNRQGNLGMTMGSGLLDSGFGSSGGHGGFPLSPFDSTSGPC